MKKVLFFVIFIILITSTCFAKNGDKIGNIYSTDIKAYINGIPVKSYNIGGRTCVSIEEVTLGAYYNDNSRILAVYSLAPEHLNEYSENSSTKSGKILGSIYSTDIKTYFYDNEIPSYNIGGKTCVAIEDIGNDNDFSKIGGKFIWNPTERTIKLEYMYDNSRSLSELLHEYNYGLKIENGTVSFIPDSSTSGWISTDFSGSFDYYDGRADNIIPLYYEYNKEKIIIGYNYYGENLEFNFVTDLSTPTIDKVGYSFNYFYKDLMEKVLTESGIAKFNREEVIKQHIDSWMAQVIQKYETNDYTFLYLWQPTSHGRNEILFYVRNDGTFEYVHQKLPGGNYSPRTFSNFSIDKEKEIATFKVTGAEDQLFTFNMKTCELTSQVIEKTTNQPKTTIDVDKEFIKKTQNVLPYSKSDKSEKIVSAQNLKRIGNILLSYIITYEGDHREDYNSYIGRAADNIENIIRLDLKNINENYNGSGVILYTGKFDIGVCKVGGFSEEELNDYINTDAEYSFYGFDPKVYEISQKDALELENQSKMDFLFSANADYKSTRYSFMNSNLEIIETHNYDLYYEYYTKLAKENYEEYDNTFNSTFKYYEFVTSKGAFSTTTSGAYGNAMLQKILNVVEFANKFYEIHPEIWKYPGINKNNYSVKLIDDHIIIEYPYEGNSFVKDFNINELK